MSARIVSILFAVLVSAQAAHAQAQELITLPSGQQIALFETRVEAETETLRLRFIAPDIADATRRPSFEQMSTDLETLCTQFGLAVAQEGARKPKQIVVSLSSEPIEFGESNAEIEQVFEAFSVQNETCMLEMF